MTVEPTASTPRSQTDQFSSLSGPHRAQSPPGRRSAAIATTSAAGIAWGPFARTVTVMVPSRDPPAGSPSVTGGAATVNEATAGSAANVVGPAVWAKPWPVQAYVRCCQIAGSSYGDGEQAPGCFRRRPRPRRRWSRPRRRCPGSPPTGRRSRRASAHPPFPSGRRAKIVVVGTFPWSRTP